MKNLFLLILLSFILLIGCSEKKGDFISEFAKDIKGHNSVHYKALEKYYYENEPDTTVTSFDVWVVRDASDSARSGYIWVDNHYRPYNMIYDNGDFYLAIPPKKVTVLYSNYNEDFISPVDWINVFLKPEVWADKIHASGSMSSMTDTVVNGEKCVEITTYRDNPAKYTYWINKKSYIPLYTGMERMMDGRKYVYRLDFSDFDFDDVDINKLKERQKRIISENPVDREGYDSEASRLEKMLHIGDTAPLFDGKFYSSGEKFRLSDYIGKSVIIVDFWYTHCPPCVRAMPSLSDLALKYRDKGLKVFGLNSVDNQPHSMKNLKTFLNNRNISYDVILTAPGVDLMYRINGYPTMYVIDKEGKVAFVEIGFDEEKFEKLEKRVEELLK